MTAALTRADGSATIDKTSSPGDAPRPPSTDHRQPSARHRPSSAAVPAPRPQALHPLPGRSRTSGTHCGSGSEHAFGWFSVTVPRAPMGALIEPCG